MKVTNTNRETVHLTLKGQKDGMANTASLEPGESADLDIDPKSPQIVGMVIAGVISLPKAAQEKALK